MSSRLCVGMFISFVALALMAQEPRGWKQPLLQPTFPPKVASTHALSELKMPLVHPTLPPTTVGHAVVKQHQMLLVPHCATNGLQMGVANFVVIAPSLTNGIP